jgi:hypothetical protein
MSAKQSVQMHEKKWKMKKKKTYAMTSMRYSVVVS